MSHNQLLLCHFQRNRRRFGALIHFKISDDGKGLPLIGGKSVNSGQIPIIVLVLLATPPARAALGRSHRVIQKG
jgi:hypothetical protein